MGRTLELHTPNGPVGAYLAEPDGAARAGLVVVQEIFGVNAHIRSVCERLAGEGYAALAPALFDPLEKNVELDYSEGAIARGRALRTALGWAAPLSAIAAAIEAVGAVGKVGAIGFCWGGSLAFLAACRLHLGCAVCYYGGQIAEFADEPVRAPTLFHFGAKDPLIPPEDVSKIREAQARAGAPAEFFVHPAGHGFNCDRRADFDEPSARLAWERTLAFLARHLAAGTPAQAGGKDA